MKKLLKRAFAILLALAILAGLCVFPASAASLPSSLYIQQATNVSCTRASNTMMLRARAYLSGNDNWSSITETDLTNCGAWSDSYGMCWNYTLSKSGMTFNVSETAVSGLSLASLKAILNAHPEGIAMYCGRLPHCIFVTDYVGDTIYASDPAWGYSHERRPLTSSYFGYCYGSQANILANVTAYWYVASYDIQSTGNSPIGYVDSVTADGDGRIHIRGWALDLDSPTTSLDVHVYIGGSAGDSNAEGHVIKADKTRDDIAAVYSGAGSAHGFDVVINTAKSGSQPIYVYGINVGGGENAQLNGSGTSVTITADTTKPTISDVKVTNVTSRGYTVTCTVSDNVGVTRVQMPTWTENNGQDDLAWHVATISGNTATFNVSINNHNLEYGNYITHIYADDLAGNSTSVAAPTVTVPAILDGTPITGTVEDGVYTIAASINQNVVLDVAEVSKDNGANLQVWAASPNSENQLFYIKSLGDGTYSLRALHSGSFLNLADGSQTKSTNVHQWNTSGTPNQDGKWKITDNGNGTYTFIANRNGLALDLANAKAANGNNVQAYTANKSVAQKWVLIPSTVQADFSGPSITDVKITELTSAGYRVTCTVSDPSGVAKVQMPTWTENNGQDDLIWHEATISGNTATFYVKASDHKSESGTYFTHIYAHDNKGYCTIVGAPDVTVPADAGPSITDIKITELTSAGYRVTCTVTAASGISKVRMPTWTSYNGQDDLIWHDATVSGNTATFYVKASDHNNEPGTYFTHIYATDAKEKTSFAAAPAITVPTIVGGTPITGTVADGVYTIAASINQNVVLDVAEVSKDNGANLQVWTASPNSENQLFYIKSLGNGTYSIRALHSGSYLTVGDSSQTRSTNVHQWSLSAPNQDAKWTITDNGDGTYTFIAATSGLALDLANAKAANGNNVQAYTANKSAAQKWVLIPSTVQADFSGPSITDVKVTELTSAGYRVTCTVSDPSGVAKVQMPTWTENNGQDDLIWHEATISGNTATFYVKVSDHKSESGTYFTHIYAHDNKGYCTIVGAPDITVPEDTGPSITDVKVTELTSAGYRVTCTVNAASGISKVRMPTWTSYNGQDDLIWHDATVSGNTATFYVKVSDHNNEPGTYFTHIYATDAKEKTSFAAAPAITVPTIVGGTPITGTVADGVYIIASSVNQNVALDIAEVSKDNGANLQVWAASPNSENQLFYIKSLGDGTYSIRALHSGSFLNLADGSQTTSTNVHQWNTNGTPNQDGKWKITNNGDGTYTFIANRNGLALDLANAKAANGNNVQAYTANKSVAQKWVLTPSTVQADFSGPSITDIKITELTVNGYRVTCTVSDPSGVAKVQMPTWTENNGQDDLIWHEATVSGNTATFYVKTTEHKSETGTYFTHIYAHDNKGYCTNVIAPNVTVPFGAPDGYYRIASALDTSKGLDIAGVNTANGANVQLYTYTGGANQKFELTYLGDGYYSIQAVHSGRYLDVAGGGSTPGTNIQQYEGNNSDAQQWMLKDAGDGYAYIVNKAGLYLDVYGGYTANGTNVHGYTANWSNGQKWKLIPVEKETLKGYDAGYTGGMAGSGSILAYGIDVSEHQGSGFNFQNLKNAGYTYVILRCGFVSRKDYCFEEYYAAAKAAGLNVGVYFYSYAENAAEASAEADLCLSYIQGKQFEYPVYFDFEDACARSYNGALAQEICTAFLSKIEAAGYLPGLYGYASWMDPNYGGWVPTSSICSKWECWMANYYDNTPTNVKSANYPSTYGMYQYTSSNYVNGVGPLDTNVCYKDYPSIVKTYHFNGY